MPWTGLSHRGLQCNLLWYKPTGQQHYEQFVWRDCTHLPSSNTPIADRFLNDAFLTLIILQLSPYVNISAEFACILKTINKKGLLLTTRLLCIAEPVINPFFAPSYCLFILFTLTWSPCREISYHTIHCLAMFATMPSGACWSHTASHPSVLPRTYAVLHYRQ